MNRALARTFVNPRFVLMRVGVCVIAVLVAGCAAKTGPDGVDSVADSATITPVSWPVAVPLSGCSFDHTAALTLGGQTSWVSIDSGSSSTAVSAKGCTSCTVDGITSLYDPSSGQDQGQSASASYDAGELTWSGEIYADRASLDGVPPVSLRFAAVTETDMFGYISCDSDDGAVESPVDGIMGLGPDGSLLRGTDSYLSDVVTEQGAPEAFALRYCHVGGTLWIGGFGAEQTTGSMQYSALLADDTDYLVDAESFDLVAADGTTTSFPASGDTGSLSALLDSGGPNLILPDAAYQTLIDTVSADPAYAPIFGDESWWEPGSGGKSTSTPPSDIDTALPWLNIHLDGDVVLSLPPTESYLAWFAQGDGHYGYLPSVANDTYAQADQTFLDLGNLPMYSYVVYTDREAGQVGFAPATPCP